MQSEPQAHYSELITRLLQLAADLQRRGQITDVQNQVIVGLIQTNAHLVQRIDQMERQIHLHSERWWALRDELTRAEAEQAGLTTLLDALVDEARCYPGLGPHSLLLDALARQKLYEQARDAYEPF